MSSISDDALTEEFEMFGVDLADEYYPKLRDLCLQFRQNEGQIAQEWIAFKCSTSNITGMTDANLEKFEREWLPRKSLKAPKRQNQTAVKSNLGNRIGDDDVDMISMYASTPTSTGKTGTKRQVTPDERDALRKRLADSERSPMVIGRTSDSPSSTNKGPDTPTSSRSSRFVERKAAGEVVSSFGATDNAVWKGSGQGGCVISPYDLARSLDKQYRYMFQKITDQAHALNDQIEDMEDQLKAQLGLEDLPHVGMPFQEPVQVVGRVACDSHGKLNKESVVLEGSRASSSGSSMPVSLQELKEFALFPGQVIAADAVNTSGKKMIIKNIYPSIKLPFPEVSVKAEPGSSLVALVASGPFSVSNDLYYDPLRALLETIRKDRPDVCILTGPFVDIKNNIIEGGQMDETYEQTFKKCMELIAEDTQKLNCQIVVVPSWRDAHHHPVYPQGPFTWSQKPQHVHFVSDPCTLTINGVVFGITSTDALLHLGAEEVSLGAPGGTDRLGRLVQHLLDQHSYYPLYPPSEDVNADLENFDQFVKMTVKPHVLVVPSDLRYFIKDCGGCLCVNPGRLAKGQVGGTFARLLLQPPTSTQPTSLLSTAAAQIVRI